MSKDFISWVCMDIPAGASHCMSQNRLCLLSHPCNPLCEVRSRCCSVPQVRQGELCPSIVWPKNIPEAASCTAGKACTPACPLSSPLIRTSASQEATHARGIHAVWEGWLLPCTTLYHLFITCVEFLLPLGDSAGIYKHEMLQIIPWDVFSLTRTKLD